jgi:hypothetical protein
MHQVDVTGIAFGMKRTLHDQWPAMPTLGEYGAGGAPGLARKAQFQQCLPALFLNGGVHRVRP